MNALSLGFTRPWTVLLPRLTRYLEAEYVDLFFNDGTLRLSSFKAFREHADEERGDLLEGRVAMEIKAPNGQHAIVSMNGQEAYVLCAGTVENKTMEASFATNSGFRILNTLAFADSISKQIAGFVGGFQGPCIYRDDVVIRKEDKNLIKPPDEYNNPEEFSEEYDKYVQRQTIDGYFVKRLKFAHQSEYRFIWFAQGEEKKYLDIKCPEAIKFCEKLS